MPCHTILGLLLTTADSGNKGVEVVGPSNLKPFWDASSYFFNRPNILVRTVQNSQRLNLPSSGEIEVTAYPIGEHHICYACATPTLPGKFNTAKAMELRVPKGPLFGQLKSGRSVVLPDGTEVTADKVLEPSEVGRIFAVICKISLDEFDSVFLGKLLEEEGLTRYATSLHLFHYPLSVYFKNQLSRIGCPLH